jgi:hypothetical protein
MAYTTINKSSDYFNTKLYTGDATTSHAITGVNFQPDMTWIKSRTSTDTHGLFDAVRGATKRIIPNNATAEGTQSNGLTSFDSDGFTVSDAGLVNQNYNYASWNWKANGAGSANTDGTINSTVSVNQTAGFSIVTYSGNATTGATIGHGLNSVPKMIIVKSRTNGADWWGTYHYGIGNTKAVWINDNNIQQTRTYWNNTSPTSSVFTVSNERSVNGSGETFVAYCFADVTGYSKFGSYVGASSTDGAFIYLGFKPTFFMAKSVSNSTENWYIFDSKREGYNPENRDLYADLTAVEGSADWLDLVSNGVKFRYNSAGLNGSSNTYIFMAFGQSLVGSNNVPCTAR